MANSVQFVTNDSGEKTAVVLPIAEYERLMEDLGDYAAIADRRKEPTISHEQFVSELKQAAPYRLEWRRSTKKDLRRIPPQEVAKIVRVVEGLIDNPFPTGCRKLVSSERAYRIRVGNYRILYEVFSDILIIEIIRVAHRKKAYEE